MPDRLAGTDQGLELGADAVAPAAAGMTLVCLFCNRSNRSRMPSTIGRSFRPVSRRPKKPLPRSMPQPHDRDAFVDSIFSCLRIFGRRYDTRYCL